MHLCTVLQVFDALDALRQLELQAGQRLARQRSPGLGGIALPGERVGDVELGLGEQRLRLLGPFGGDRLLALGALELVEFSRSRRAAPLSRPLSSLKTSCICSGAGLPASQSRMRAARSPEVGAVKAPPVSVSRA